MNSSPLLHNLFFLNPDYVAARWLHSLHSEKNSGSYLVQFQSLLDQPGFGKIHVGYAVVNIFRNTRRNICQTGISPAKDPVLKEILLAGVLGSHFIRVKETQNFKVIPSRRV